MHSVEFPPRIWGLLDNTLLRRRPPPPPTPAMATPPSPCRWRLRARCGSHCADLGHTHWSHESLRSHQIPLPQGPETHASAELVPVSPLSPCPPCSWRQYFCPSQSPPKSSASRFTWVELFQQNLEPLGAHLYMGAFGSRTERHPSMLMMEVRSLHTSHEFGSVCQFQPTIPAGTLL